MLLPVLCYLLLSQHHFYGINAFFQVFLCCLGLCKAENITQNALFALEPKRNNPHPHWQVLTCTFWAHWGFWFRSSLSTPHPPAAAKILALLWSKFPPGSAVLLSERVGKEFSAQEGTCQPWKMCGCHRESPTFGGVASWSRFSPNYFRNLGFFSDKCSCREDG